MDIFISGGGQKVLCFLGCIYHLFETGKYDNSKLHSYGGSSGGSIIVTLLAANINPKDIFDFITDTEFKEYFKFNIETLTNDFSIYEDSSKAIRVIFDNFNIEDIPIRSFNDKYNCDINIMTTSLKKKKSVIFNQETFPDVGIITAVLASCCIPVLFKPVEIYDDVYLDGDSRDYGTMINNYLTPETILIKLIQNRRIFENLDSLTLAEYITECLWVPFLAPNIKHTDHTYVIKLDNPSNLTDMRTMSLAEKIKLFTTGIDQTISILRGI